MPQTPSSDLAVPFDTDRYSRQILFPGIGEAGQRRLADAHVAIVGCGATGAASASLLARAGVGTLTIVDRDFVESSNLQRQVLFDESDAAASLPKAEAARRKIALFNSTIAVLPHVADLVPANINELLGSAEIILDATDNFETRYLINDFAVQQSKPWIYAAAIGAYAATMNILPVDALRANSDATACLACIFPKPPSGPTETCDTAGILSTAVNLAASIQVTETLKYLTGQSFLMRRSLLSFDLWSNDRSEISTAKPDPACTVCGDREFTHLAGTSRPHITLCGRNSVQIHEHRRPVDLGVMHARLAPHGVVRSNDLLLRFERPPAHAHVVQRWPGDHSGNHGPRRRSHAICPLHRLLTRSIRQVQRALVAWHRKTEIIRDSPASQEGSTAAMQESTIAQPEMTAPAIPLNVAIPQPKPNSGLFKRNPPIAGEAEAIERAKAGDPEAFSKLYALHKRRVYTLCLRMLGNVSEAEDMTQEAFLHLFRKLGSFRGESAFSTWLHRMTVNLVLMQLRKKGLNLVSLEETINPSEEDAPKRDFGKRDPQLAGSVDRVALERAVALLPPGYRMVFVLHDVEGFEHNEIATMLECSTGNSKSQLHKARLKLRELLRQTEAQLEPGLLKEAV